MALIVIVDDRSTNRTIYSKLAESIGEGVEVRAFGDSGEALEWLQRNRPDLIVTDYDMPKIAGDEFISRFRALPHSAGVPIMMITVNDQRTLRLRALESGATDFLNTPIDHFEFLSRARNLLKLSQRVEVGATTEKAPAAPKSAPARHGQRQRDAASPEAALAAETRKLLAQCGRAAPYALHVMEIDVADGAEFDAPGFAASLRPLLRGGDLLGCVDRLRLLALQQNVVDLADASACARRLIAFGAATAGVALRVGSAMPRPGAGSPEIRAVECLREAFALARKPNGREAARAEGAHDGARDGAPAEGWRFLPRINLRTGAVSGAQFLRGSEPAEAGDPEALRAALAGARELRAGRRPLRLSLRLRIGGEGAAASTLRVASLLSKTRVQPGWLDLQLCAREALAEPRRADEAAHILNALGVGLTLDLRSLSPRDLAARGEWAAPLGQFAEAWRPAIIFPCGDARSPSVARLIRAAVARRLGRAPTLLADGVASPALLTPLRRAGVGEAQGACFGAPFAARDLNALLAAWPALETPARVARRA